MKRTFALFYRFLYIVFGVWGVCRHIGLNILTISPRILSFTFIVNTLSLLCIIILIFFNLNRKSFANIRVLKNALTFASLMILLSNPFVFGGYFSNQWIWSILLPTMFTIDWLLFDKKGYMKFYEPFSWLLYSLMLIAVLGLFFKFVLGDDSFWNVVGLFSNLNELLYLTIKSVIAGICIFVFDYIIGAFTAKSYRNIFELLFRIVFVLLLIYAIVTYFKIDVTGLLNKIGV